MLRMMLALVAAVAAGSIACTASTVPLRLTLTAPAAVTATQAGAAAGSRPAGERADENGAALRFASRFNVYASTVTGTISPTLKGIPERVYVPNSDAATLSVIDPARLEVIARIPVGSIPHHVTPAWDLSELYINNEGSSSLSVIDPRTATITRTIPVPYPYNLYFTPDGSKAVVVVERLRRLDFRDPKTWQLIKSVEIPWPGADHLDFSADGSFFLISTEWSGMVVKVDTRTMEVTGTVDVGQLPIDVRLTPDGTHFFVTNQGRNGVSVIDAGDLREVAWIPTGKGAHGLFVSRDTRQMYVSNRLAGTISVIDIATREVTATWNVGSSPDMMQLSPDGSQLWVSGRYTATVDVIDVTTGKLLKRIPTGGGAHGLTFFPNAGDHSTGHNGVYR